MNFPLIKKDFSYHIFMFISLRPLHAFGIVVAMLTAIICFISMTTDLNFVMYFGAHYISLAGFLASMIMIKGILEVSIELLYCDMHEV